SAPTRSGPRRQPASTSSCSTRPATTFAVTASRWTACFRGARSRSHRATATRGSTRSEEHTSELQSLTNLVCRLLLEKKKLISPGGLAQRRNVEPPTRSHKEAGDDDKILLKICRHNLLVNELVETPSGTRQEPRVRAD